MGAGSAAVGGGVVYWGPLESLLALPRHVLIVPSIGSACNTLDKTPFLIICWVIRVWGPVLLTSLWLCGPASVCIIITKIGLFSWLLRAVPVLVLLRWGGGVVFLKATSYVCPVLLSPLCLWFCCSAPLLPSLPTLILGKRICNICVHCGRGPPFHLMLYL